VVDGEGRIAGVRFLQKRKVVKMISTTLKSMFLVTRIFSELEVMLSLGLAYQVEVAEGRRATCHDYPGPRFSAVCRHPGAGSRRWPSVRTPFWVAAASLGQCRKALATSSGPSSSRGLPQSHDGKCNFQQ